MSLSDAAIRSAKPAAKQFKLYDEGGLFLIVHEGRRWEKADVNLELEAEPILTERRRLKCSLPRPLGPRVGASVSS